MILGSVCFCFFKLQESWRIGVAKFRLFHLEFTINIYPCFLFPFSFPPVDYKRHDTSSNSFSVCLLRARISPFSSLCQSYVWSTSRSAVVEFTNPVIDSWSFQSSTAQDITVSFAVAQWLSSSLYFSQGLQTSKGRGLQPRPQHPVAYFAFQLGFLITLNLMCSEFWVCSDFVHHPV